MKPAKPKIGLVRFPCIVERVVDAIHSTLFNQPLGQRIQLAAELKCELNECVHYWVSDGFID